MREAWGEGEALDVETQLEAALVDAELLQVVGELAGARPVREPNTQGPPDPSGELPQEPRLEALGLGGDGPDLDLEELVSEQQDEGAREQLDAAPFGSFEGEGYDLALGVDELDGPGALATPGLELTP